MPNKDYREQHILNECKLSNWRNVDEEEQKKIRLKFENMMINKSKKVGAIKDFRPSNWNQNNVEKKVEVCQRLEDSLAWESDRQSYKIVPICNSYGFTDGKNKEININVYEENSYKILETVVHESCHADQIELCEKRKKIKDDKNSMIDFQKELEQYGLSDNDLLVMDWETYEYISSDEVEANISSKKLCHMQLIEIDARYESVKFLRKYCGDMEDNGGFDQYVEKREKKLEEKRNYFKDKETVKMWLEDRKKRFLEEKDGLYSKEDREKLKTIYFSQNIENCGFKLLINLENWQRYDKAGVDTVTFDELMGDQKKGVENQTKPNTKILPTTSREVGMGLGR